MKTVEYKFYGTLLDAFSYYLNSDSDDAFSEFIDKLNRVPFESEAARKGTALNELVDERVAGMKHYLDIDGNYHHKGFKFSREVIDYLVDTYKSAFSQVYTEGVLQTKKGRVLLYGYIDELLPGEVHDIKGTGSYCYPKFLNSWQKVVYPFCLESQGIFCHDFTYMITDYSQIFREDYRYKPERDIPRLVLMCEELIDFIENHRKLITDRKLFAMENEVFTLAMDEKSPIPVKGDIKTYGSRGEEVELVSTSGPVAIVEGRTGRFPVRKENLIPKPE